MENPLFRPDMDGQTIREGKTIAIIGYLTLIGTFIGITMNIEPKNAYARFHLRQAFGIHMVFFVFAIMNNMWGNLYGFYGIWVGYLVLWIYGFVGALNQKFNTIPFLGPYFQKWFTFVP
ncbi:MAG: hypothetical protein AB3N16_15335 [Flavobacteriaceae bacterium]